MPTARRRAATVLSAGLLLFAVACGGNDDGSGDTRKSPAHSTQEPGGY